MPRSKDPQAAVLSYFETASLPDARATQKFVAHIVRRREATEPGSVLGAAAPTKAKATPKARKARRTRTPRATAALLPTPTPTTGVQ